MDTLGKHLLVEYHGCDNALLNDLEALRTAMTEAAQAAGATVVDAVFHAFAPQGSSGVVVIEESHLSVHTWPERGYAAIDFYTCGNAEPWQAHLYLQGVLRPERSEILRVSRGLHDGESPSMEIVSHSIYTAEDVLLEEASSSRRNAVGDSGEAVRRPSTLS